MPQAVALKPPRDVFVPVAKEAKPRVSTESIPSGGTGSAFVPPLDFSGLFKKSFSHHEDSSINDDACTTGGGQPSSTANTLTSNHPTTSCTTNVSVNGKKNNPLTQRSLSRQRNEEELCRAFKSLAEYSRAYFASFAEEAMNDHIALKDIITKKQKRMANTAAMPFGESIDLLSAYCEPLSHRLLDREARRLAYEQLCERGELQQRPQKKNGISKLATIIFESLIPHTLCGVLARVKCKVSTVTALSSEKTATNEVFVARVGFGCGRALGTVLYLFVWTSRVVSNLFTDTSARLFSSVSTTMGNSKDGIVYSLVASACMCLRRFVTLILTSCGFFFKGLLMECLRLLKVYIVAGALFALGTNIIEPLLYSDVNLAEEGKGANADESSDTDFTSSFPSFYAAEDGHEGLRFSTQPSRSPESPRLKIRSRDSGALVKRHNTADPQTSEDLNGLLSDLDSVIMTLGTAAVCITIVWR